LCASWFFFSPQSHQESKDFSENWHGGIGRKAKPIFKLHQHTIPPPSHFPQGCVLNAVSVVSALMRLGLSKLSARLSSLIWNLLRGYGKIKYRYLLPVYRLLRLLPGEAKAPGTARPSATLRYTQALIGFLKRTTPDTYRQQLLAVLERARSRKGVIIFPPSVGWDLINVQRSHHMAREFARQGYLSIFDCTNAYDDVDGFKEIEPNLFLFRADESLLYQFPQATLWTLTYNFDRKDAYPTHFQIIYDWIDDIEVFPYDRQFMEANHDRALQESTVVASVARRLHEQALLTRPNALYLPNGVDDQHFADEKIRLPEDADLGSLLEADKPVAGYYGAFAEWFDYELLAQLAALRPDWNFLLIGQPYDLSMKQRGEPMLKHPNVHWIGPRKYEVLPAYLRLFDVAMIPFLINDITLATSPLKLYEYFAGGKPVITSPMPECLAYREVFAAQHLQQFSEALDSARLQGRDQNFRDRLRRMGRENSWAARVKTLEAYLRNSDSQSEEK
jgi:glycosyltransferase involved in cell wall biosynthesis